MKKNHFPAITLCLLLAHAAIAATPFGTTANDEIARLDCELAQLSELEQAVNISHATYHQLAEAQHPLLQNLLPDSDLAASLFSSAEPGGERLLDIPGFIWGLCCSVAGVFLMYLAIEDPASRKKEGKQAIIGCAIGDGRIGGGLFDINTFGGVLLDLANPQRSSGIPCVSAILGLQKT